MKLVYLDASAVVKLFKLERETSALETILRDRPVWVSSELLAVEARCTARRSGDLATLEAAEEVLARIELIPLTLPIRARAGEAFRPALRALDAVHAATALDIGDELDLVLAYDLDLRHAMAGEGLDVIAPGST